MADPSKLYGILLQTRPVVTLANGLESQILPSRVVVVDSLVDFDDHYLPLDDCDA